MIVAFYSERSGSGKDSAAEFAAEYLRAQGIGVRRDAFAWDGKVVCADALGIEVIDRARDAREHDYWTVISDLRFVEEATAVRQAGGWVVEIDRPDGSLGTFNEQRLPPSLVDQTLRNDGTLDDLRSKVQGYVHGLVAYAAR